MQSNLPPGCRPIDEAVDRAVDAKECIACKFYNRIFHRLCEVCKTSKDAINFREVDDLAVVAERMKAEAESRKDGHRDD